jgi:hypothetical protein
MTKLYKFHWDCGRQGCVEGIFSADDATVKAAIGQDVHFGEILGKHSEVYGPLEKKDLKVLTDDEPFIARAMQYGLVPSGYNPLEHLTEGE